MRTLERRLAKLEQELLPPPERAFVLLTAPQSDAPWEVWSEHQRNIDEAKARGDFVGVVSSRPRMDRPHDEKNVAYFADEIEALFEKLVHLPSERGNKNRLADVLKSLSGNIFGPVMVRAFGTKKPSE